RVAGIRTWEAKPRVRPLRVARRRPGGRVQTEEAFGSDRGTEARTRDEVLPAAREGAGSEIARAWGADPEAWLWGKFHTVTMEVQPNQGMLAPHLTVGPYAAPGGLFTVNVANPPVQVGCGLPFAHLAVLRTATQHGAECDTPLRPTLTTR